MINWVLWYTYYNLHIVPLCALRMWPIWPMLLPSWMLVGRSHRWPLGSSWGVKTPLGGPARPAEACWTGTTSPTRQKCEAVWHLQAGAESCMYCTVSNSTFQDILRKRPTYLGWRPPARMRISLPKNMHPKDLGYPLDRWLRRRLGHWQSSINPGQVFSFLSDRGSRFNFPIPKYRPDRGSGPFC